MKALVTGATGFVGSHLVERLLREGLQVACLVRRTSSLTWLAGLPVETRVGALDEGDLGGAADAVAEADYVFHVAGLTRARSLVDYMAVNAEGTRRLVQAVVRGNKRLRRLVYVSSLAAAGPCPGSEPLDERAEPHPLEGYGLSKLVAEQVVLAERRRLPVCIVRPPAVYGPRDTNFLPLFRAAQRYRLAPVIGSTRKQVSLVHVADLVEGIWLAATRLRQGFGGQARPDQGFGGLGSLQQGGGEAASPDGTASAAEDEVFFIGSGTHSWLEIVAALGTALGVRLRSPRIPALLARLVGELGELKWMLTRKPQIICRRKVRDMLQERWTCSWARAERELGYRPRVALADGLRETAEWYASQGWLRPLRNP